MFKRIFGKEEEEEEVFETVDPVLEQRRKEKFSTPLIYNDETELKAREKELEEKKVEPVQKPTISIDTSYRMSEIISPMTGVEKSVRQEVKTSKPKFHKPKKEKDELIPIISPFYGAADANDEDIDIEPPVYEEDVSVENNLRNIAHIVAEEKDQLKIIEERTGEFKLDFQNQEKDSFIDEIDDSMSLDELMSLYEKKFKD